MNNSVPVSLGEDFILTLLSVITAVLWLIKLDVRREPNENVIAEIDTEAIDNQKASLFIL